MKTIELTRGAVAIVDDEDYAALSALVPLPVAPPRTRLLRLETARAKWRVLAQAEAERHADSDTERRAVLTFMDELEKAA